MSLYRVVRADPSDPTVRYPKGRTDVRYGSRPMVAGIVRDTLSRNRSRKRYSDEHPDRPVPPVQLTIELVVTQSLTDVTAEFTEDQ